MSFDAWMRKSLKPEVNLDLSRSSYVPHIYMHVGKAVIIIACTHLTPPHHPLALRRDGESPALTSVLTAHPPTLDPLTTKDFPLDLPLTPEQHR